ncbi:MAG: MBL fold metallo-hydrolase [Alicyclobacillus sp.]|nr:MBL fold metallo-hydrolase [Alicyclobacillus sp.]
MKLGNQMEALELTMDLGGSRSSIYPVLLWDEQGAVLVDTGMPGQLDAIRQAVEAAGVRFADIRHIILTHQDIDHIGSLPELVEALDGVEVWAHNDDVPYIQGERPLMKMNRDRMEKLFEQLPEDRKEMAMRILDHPPHAHVDHILHGGETLPFHGGVQVIHTPGHTPGHISLFVPSEGLLISGDELRVVDGELEGPAEGATPDMAQALKSLGKLVPFDVRTVICYHGGTFDRNPAQRILALHEAADQAAGR